MTEIGLQDLANWLLDVPGGARAIGLRFDGEVATLKRFENGSKITEDEYNITEFKKFCGIARRSASEPTRHDSIQEAAYTSQAQR